MQQLVPCPRPRPLHTCALHCPCPCPFAWCIHAPKQSLFVAPWAHLYRPHRTAGASPSTCSRRCFKSFRYGRFQYCCCADLYRPPPYRRRKSINVLKEMFRDELSKDDWRLVIKLKKIFKID